MSTDKCFSTWNMNYKSWTDPFFLVENIYLWTQSTSINSLDVQIEPHALEKKNLSVPLFNA